MLTVLLLGPVLFAQSLDDFRLPPKSVFDSSMPRYPNLWFYIDPGLARSHDAAVKLVTSRLRNAMQLPEFFPPFENPEGCDFEVRVEHLQPWIDPARRALQHAHAFHMRYYYTALSSPRLAKVRIPWRGATREFYRFAASAHYEVEHANPHHADVEECPICGRTGPEYGKLEGGLVEQVHDPLGLELLLTGAIRGQRVHHEDWERRPFGGIQTLSADYHITSSTHPGQTTGRNTLRIGIVVFEPKR
ncbi:MAG: hypothetical protein WD696_11440 [Bryobacteraceae bacterium]